LAEQGIVGLMQRILPDHDYPDGAESSSDGCSIKRSVAILRALDSVCFCAHDLLLVEAVSELLRMRVILNALQHSLWQSCQRKQSALNLSAPLQHVPIPCVMHHLITR
jgi:hypothetical protein